MPRPHEIMGEAIAQKYATGIGEARRNARESVAHRCEHVALAHVQGMRRIVGAGEMTHQQADIQAFHEESIVQQRIEFGV